MVSRNWGINFWFFAWEFSDFQKVSSERCDVGIVAFASDYNQNSTFAEGEKDSSLG